MMKLGITGGIGSGKSYVSRLLERRGIPVYDTDAAAKRLMVEHPSVRRELMALLGAEAYLPDGTLNRPLLARCVFTSAVCRARVNAIVHPRVREDFARWVAVGASGSGVVAMECAILYEAHFETEVDKVLVVSAPAEVRMRRVMERDGATEAQVKGRMAAQMDEDERCARADGVVLNDGCADVEAQLEAWIAAFGGRKD